MLAAIAASRLDFLCASRSPVKCQSWTLLLQVMCGRKLGGCPVPPHCATVKESDFLGLGQGCPSLGLCSSLDGNRRAGIAF